MAGKLWLSTALMGLLLLTACNSDSGGSNPQEGTNAEEIVSPEDVVNPDDGIILDGGDEQEEPLPKVQIEAAYYDTCIWSEQYADLRCFGYNDGAHGNGHTEEVGDSFGEIEYTKTFCKTAPSDEWVFTVEGTDAQGGCGFPKYEFTVTIKDALDQSVSTDAMCGGRPSRTYEIKSAVEEIAPDADNCVHGGYNIHLGEDRTRDGKLQITDMGEELKPTLLPDGLSVVEFAVGYSFACAILSDQTTRCWGSGDELGNANSAVNTIEDVEDLGNQLPEVDLGTDRYATKLSSVEDFICALLDNGTVKCWGDNNEGQLGQGHSDNLGGDDNEMGDNLVAIDLGTNPQTSAPYKTIDIAAAEDTVCAVLEDGRVKCWGENKDGLHGVGHSSLNADDNPHYAIGDDPDEMGDNLLFVDLPLTVQATAVYMAYGHACVTTQDNELYCWGENSDGQLGLGDDESRGDGFYVRETAYDNGNKANRKKDIVELDGTELGQQLCSLAPNNGGIHGRLYLDNNTNNLFDDGDESLLERTVCDTEDRVAFLTARLYSHQAYLQYGQFGSDFSEMGDALKPVYFGTSAAIKDVSIGYYNTCVLFDNNELKCFGEGDYRGADTEEDAGDSPSTTPDLIAPVDLGTDKLIADIASAGYQTCVAFVDSTVKCFGYNEYGEAGYPEYEGEDIGDGDPEPEMGENLPFVEIR